MPGVTSLIQMRQRRRQQRQRDPRGRIGLGCSAALALFLAVAGVYTALAYSRITRDLPSIEVLPALLEPPDGLLLRPTRLVDRSGEQLLLTLQNPAAAGRQYLRLPGSQAGEGPAFSEALITATLAAADPKFETHAGFSPTGLFAPQPDGNRPTLAQKLASDLLLPDEPDSLRRAVRERLLAAQITRRYGRAKILEWYLNSADYGRLAFGADAAARVYLGKSAADLDLAEAALLAATAQDPTQNPHDLPQAALARQKQVLEAALRYRLADPLAAAQAAQQTLAIRAVERPGQALRIEDLQPAVDPVFLGIALQQAGSAVPRRRLLRGGLTLQTTLDSELQRQAACALAAQTARLGAAAPAAGDCPAGRLLPALDIPAGNPGIRAQALALDPQTGQILALAAPGEQPAAAAATLTGVLESAGRPPGEAARLLTPHPIGTLGTPWIYLTAFTRGLSPASLTWDIPPEGDDGVDAGQGPMRARLALANDRLRPAEQILNQVGAQNVLQTARQFGLGAPEARPEAAGEAGAAESPETLFRPFSLLELGQAFGVLANEGMLAGRSLATAGDDPARPAPLQAYALLRIEDDHGQMLLDWSAWQTRPIIAAGPAYLMNNVLSDETARWPSLGRPNPLEIGRPAAAKIGSTPDGKNAWTIGYTHDRLVGVWIGLPEASSPPPELRERLPLAGAGLYHALMKFAHQSLPARGWTVPEGVQTVKVCDPSGMLPTAYCPNVVDEIFLEANAPLQRDRLYRSAAVNRETGRLATIFTPPDQVIEQPYMQAPPEAAAWARRLGQKTPPDVYDTVGPAPNQPDGVQITAPEMFAVVRGKLAIRGKIRLEELDYYRIQVGQGMNPQAWIQVGEDAASAPPGDAPLGEWDTRGLSGLYVVELMAVDRQGSVQRAHVLVSVDNQAPQVEIVSPLPQEEISRGERPQVVLLADVEDDLGEVQVEMYLDGKRLARSAAGPYAFVWNCTLGAHTLRVVAIDRAGNTTEISSAFQVIP